MTKTQVTKAMKTHGISGEVTGKGQDWEVELPTEEAKDAFRQLVCQVGGFKTGYGAWVLRPNYVSQGDWNVKSSRCHY